MITSNFIQKIFILILNNLNNFWTFKTFISMVKFQDNPMLYIYSERSWLKIKNWNSYPMVDRRWWNSASRVWGVRSHEEVARGSSSIFAYIRIDYRYMTQTLLSLTDGNIRSWKTSSSSSSSSSFISFGFAKDH